MSCGVGQRYGSEPMLLWLWYRPTATAPIRLLAWELPYATGAALKSKNKERKKKKRKYLTHLKIKKSGLINITFLWRTSRFSKIKKIWRRTVVCLTFLPSSFMSGLREDCEILISSVFNLLQYEKKKKSRPHIDMEGKNILMIIKSVVVAF